MKGKVLRAAFDLIPSNKPVSLRRIAERAGCCKRTAKKWLDQSWRFTRAWMTEPCENIFKHQSCLGYIRRDPPPGPLLDPDEVASST